MIFILYLSIDQGTEVNLSVVSNFLGSLQYPSPSSTEKFNRRQRYPFIYILTLQWSYIL